MAIDTIFFDRDGVINDIVRREELVSSPRELQEFCIRPDFTSLYESLPSTLNLFVISNQPDVARGLLKISVLEQMNEQLRSSFSFREIVYCPHDNADKCLCRKPKPGMIKDLILKYGLIKETAMVVGDSEKDVLAGQAAGIQTVYFKQPHNRLPSCAPDFVIEKLSDMLTILAT